MANETVSVSGPISVKNDTKESVALDLMKFIGDRCYSSDQSNQNNKEYWLKLYRQCWKAANGNGLEYILKED